ncbi:MAG TPA: 3',5'-cyclic-nucleotide phosphodiesterase [Anaeromyxobacter sp.]|nr:3',5'-cyclic-nucleotide phosphodiesterase [Anaeromyxobacter sp.]
MRIRVLGCSGGELPRHRTTCFLVDDGLAIDAGALTASLSLKELARVDDIVLTHSHFDHVKDVPLLADLLVGRRPDPFRVHASTACARTLRESIFNGELWPDFTRIPDRQRPVIEIVSFPAQGRFRLGRQGRYRVQTVPVNHPVESVGVLVSDGRTTIGVSGDTGPTEGFWRAVNASRRVAALLVELSFPSSLQWLADASGHLTPSTLRGELEKLERNGVPVLLYHYKPAHLAELKRELAGLRLANVRVLRQGEELTF